MTSRAAAGKLEELVHRMAVGAVPMRTRAGQLRLRLNPPVFEVVMNTKHLVLSAVLAAALGGLVSCRKGAKKAQESDTKEIELVVKQDTELASSEEELLKKRGALIKLRRELHRKRMELEKKKQELAGKDPAAAKDLEAQEASLREKERQIMAQEQAILKQLDRLFDQRAALLSKAKSVLQVASAGRGVPDIAKREHAIAVREKEVARREAELAKREAELAKREAELAKREKELAKGCAGFAAPSIVVPRISLPAAGGKRYSKADVEATYGKAMHILSSKGILTRDLPGPVAKLRSDVRKYLRSKEYARAKFAADQFLAYAKALKVDRAFVAAKIARLNRIIQKKRLSPDTQRKVNRLFTAAVSAYSDGNFRRANAQLNRIYGLLK